MSNFLSNLPILAHFLIGFYFAFLGCWNIYHWVPLMTTLGEKNIPHPYLVLPIGISIQIIAGVMIMFGIFTKLAALFLIIPTIVTVFIFHPFWQFKGEKRALNFSLFVSDLTIVLGALILILGS